MSLQIPELKSGERLSKIDPTFKKTLNLVLSQLNRFSCARDIESFNVLEYRTLQKCFRIIKQVGKGTFGEVYKAYDVTNNKIVALKKLHIHIENEGFPVTALREVKCLQQLKHQNIVNLREVVPATFEGIGHNTSFMVFDYLQYDLTGLLENRRVKLDIQQIKCLMKQLLEGIHFVHTNKIMHRDIKAANLLLNSKGELKIGDWGLARSWVENFSYTTKVVTMWYRAPELLLGLKKYDLKIDIWAIGCIFAELITKKCVLPGKDEADQLNLIFELCGTPSDVEWPFHPNYLNSSSVQTPPVQRTLENRYASVMPPDALSLFREMLVLNPANRMSASSALDHDFFWKGLVEDSPERMINKIKLQLGIEMFNTGMHEFELRKIMKRSRMKEEQPVLNLNTKQGIY